MHRPEFIQKDRKRRGENKGEAGGMPSIEIEKNNRNLTKIGIVNQF
jgi:hypothetical protein